MRSTFGWSKFVTLFVVATIQPLSSLAWASSLMDHPERPFLSSVPALFLTAPQFSPHTETLNRFPARRLKISGLNGYQDLRYTFRLQSNKQAPVVFLIPGVGGTAETNTNLFLAELAYREGFAVITLPSTTHWSFALAGSTSGRPGHLPDDAKDLYQVMAMIKKNLEKNHGLQASKWGLVGYSYGGLDASFILDHDSRNKFFNFSFAVLISPPLERSVAIQKIDRYFAMGANWPENYKQQLNSFAQGRLVEISKGGRSINSFEALEAAFPLKEAALAWLLANEFRRGILNSAHVGNLIENKSGSTINKAFVGSIGDYLNQTVQAQKNASSESAEPMANLAKASELKTVLNKNSSSLLRGRQVVIFHSRNDYTSFPEGESFLNTLPIQKHIYDFGGHLGFLSDRQVLSDLRAVLNQLK